MCEIIPKLHQAGILFSNTLSSSVRSRMNSSAILSCVSGALLALVIHSWAGAGVDVMILQKWQMSIAKKSIIEVSEKETKKM
jgi:hypothetical protein